MLLSVAETAAEVVSLRAEFVRLGFFTYSATFEDMVALAQKYPLTDLIVRAVKVTELLKQRVEHIVSLYPELNVFLLSDNTSHTLSARRQLPFKTDAYEMLFQIMYYGKPSPNSAPAFYENLMVKGMLFNTYRSHIRIYGWLIPFSQSDVFLLRYLAEIYPRRASCEELAALCFSYGQGASESAVRSRISRINAKASEHLPALTRPVVTYKRNQGGYQIDF